VELSSTSSLLEIHSFLLVLSSLSLFLCLCFCCSFTIFCFVSSHQYRLIICIVILIQFLLQTVFPLVLDAALVHVITLSSSPGVLCRSTFTRSKISFLLKSWCSMWITSTTSWVIVWAQESKKKCQGCFWQRASFRITFVLVLMTMYVCIQP